MPGYSYLVTKYGEWHFQKIHLVSECWSRTREILEVHNILFFTAINSGYLDMSCRSEVSCHIYFRCVHVSFIVTTHIILANLTFSIFWSNGEKKTVLKSNCEYQIFFIITVQAFHLNNTILVGIYSLFNRKIVFSRVLFT